MYSILVQFLGFSGGESVLVVPLHYGNRQDPELKALRVGACCSDATGG